MKHRTSYQDRLRRQLHDALYAAVRRALDHSLFFAPRPLVVQVLAEIAAEQAEIVARENIHKNQSA